MGRLVLVKHSLVDPVPGRPARTWELSAEGRRRALALAARLRDLGPRRIASSAEPKAAETAEIVGGHLGVPVMTVPGLHEHARETAPYLGREDFEAAVAWLFEEPGKVVFGEESADAAADRFAAAVDDSVAAGANVIVAHGTVIALHVSRLAGVDPFGLWRSLGLPSYVVVSQGSRRQVEVVSEAY